jgi:bifunctional NMN adenylyltransferase/nudix hydrolase
MRWSDWLDMLVEKRFPGRKAVMRGSRDSFLDVYTGRHEHNRVEQISEISGTEARASIKQSSAMSVRESIIYNEMTRPAIAYSTEDIAIVDDEHERVLAITKHWFDGLFSLTGGFLDPEKDPSDEAGARREKMEEVLGITTGDTYEPLGPRIKVDDPRYRRSKDKIYTQLYCTQYVSGVPQHGDDAKGTRWMSRNDLDRLIVPWHMPLVERIKARWDSLHNRQALVA